MWNGRVSLGNVMDKNMGPAEPAYWCIETGQAQQWGLQAALLYAHLVDACAVAPNGWAALSLRCGDGRLAHVMTPRAFRLAAEVLLSAGVIEVRRGAIGDVGRRGRAFDRRLLAARIVRGAGERQMDAA